jgi:hypothetical protein
VGRHGEQESEGKRSQRSQGNRQRRACRQANAMGSRVEASAGRCECAARWPEMVAHVDKSFLQE